MFKSSLLALCFTFSVAPLLSSAALFPKDSKVKLLDAKGFSKAMKTNHTSLGAFMAPWCGHCQRLVPEYSKVATALHPMIPVYAVDCDVEANKRLCAEQGVKGFPTIKLFPRGSELGSMMYDGERAAGAIFKWTSLRIPNTVEKLSKPDDIKTWSKKNIKANRALLITSDTKIPILWKVLSNNFKGKLSLGVHRDQDGSSLKAFGLDSGSSKVLIYPSGSTKSIPYSGKTKMEPLSKFFSSIIDGTVELNIEETEGSNGGGSSVKETSHFPSKDEL